MRPSGSMPTMVKSGKEAMMAPPGTPGAATRSKPRATMNGRNVMAELSMPFINKTPRAVLDTEIMDPGK